jgi:hypothetical protein
MPVGANTYYTFTVMLAINAGSTFLRLGNLRVLEIKR